MLKAAVVFCIFILSGSAWPVSTRLGTIDVSNPLAKRLVQFSKPTHSGGGSISLPDRERSLFVARINTVGIREFDVYYVFDAADEAQYLIQLVMNGHGYDVSWYYFDLESGESKESIIEAFKKR